MRQGAWHQDSILGINVTMRKTIERLISSLNDGDVDSLKDLFSDDVSFRDLNGWECSNGDDLVKALTEYLHMFPDFETMVLDIEEMTGSFKVYVQTFGHMNDEMRRSIIDQGQALPTDEELHPPAIWKIGFTDRRINLWNMDSIALSKKMKDIALSFIWAINTGKPENVISLITNSHTEGTNVEVEQGNRNHWIEAWEGYYRLFPDYRIYPENIHVRGDRVIILGRSDGTMSDYAKKH